MANLDIKDTYYSIPIYEPYLKFQYKSRLFKFIVLLNGCIKGPIKFTKLWKPPLSLLRKLERVLVASYFGDLITIDWGYSAFSSNMKIIKLKPSLGLIIHPSKSIFFPCQESEYLGFIINSINMTLTITLVKKHNIILLCDKMLSSPHIKIGKFLNRWANFPAASLLFTWKIVL